MIVLFCECSLDHLKNCNKASHFTIGSKNEGRIPLGASKLLQVRLQQSKLISYVIFSLSNSGENRTKLIQLSLFNEKSLVGTIFLQFEASAVNVLTWGWEVGSSTKGDHCSKSLGTSALHHGPWYKFCIKCYIVQCNIKNLGMRQY